MTGPGRPTPPPTLPAPLHRGFERLPAHGLDAAGDTLARIVAGELLGVVVEGVYDRASMARVVGRLDGGEDLPPAIPFAPFRDHEDPPYERGRALVSARDGLERYLAHAVRQRAFLDRLFSGLPPLEPTIDALLTRLGGGRPAGLAPGPRPQSRYTPATLRVLTEGHGIDLHVGLSFLELPCCRHLRTIIDPSIQLSWFLTVQVPEEGGELITYGRSWQEEREAASTSRGAQGDAEVVVTGDAAAAMRRWPALPVRPAPGDVLVFNGGRWFHEVRAPRGGRRRTLGGFLSPSNDGQRILRWA